jgi:hypothetical protein
LFCIKITCYVVFIYKASGQPQFPDDDPNIGLTAISCAGAALAAGMVVGG